MKNLITLLFVVGAGLLTAMGQHYQLIKKTTVGGEGGWDYLSVDTEGKRLFLSHGNQVEVLGLDSHEKLGVIPNLSGVHGAWIVPGTGRGLIANGRTNTVIIFDAKTLQTIAELPTGKNPDAATYDPFSKYMFVFNHSDVTTTVVDVANAKVVATIDVGGNALEAGASDGKGKVYVNLEESAEIAVIDAKSLTLKERWKIAPGEEPTGLAIDSQTKRLFSVCHNGVMMIVDSENGKIISQQPIGKRVDGAVFDPETKLVFSSNGEGSITVVKEISADKFEVVQTVKTEPGARTIALDPKSHHVFVVTAQYGETPPATAENPNPRPKVIPGTFMILEYGPGK